MLLATSGAATADDSIRRLIAADNSKAEDTGILTDSLLFGGSDAPVGDKPVDADAEAARLAAAKTGGTSEKPAEKSTEKATIDKSSGSWWPF